MLHDKLEFYHSIFFPAPTRFGKVFGSRLVSKSNLIQTKLFGRSNSGFH